ncbi:MAG: SDR family oxidoreductase [Firmicutes bacterium]|nr:SDR family oxidoreductase [Bacillota bacterium]
MESKRLKNKVIVITGATKGVGRAFAKAAAAEGAIVVGGGRDEEAGIEMMKDIADAGSDGTFVPVDLNDIEDIRKIFRIAYKFYGRVDGYFSYGAVTDVSPLDNCDEETFDKIMDINFKATFFGCQEAIKYMKRTVGGSIVLTGSAHAWGGQKDRAAYACSKGALRILMEHIAHNYASDQIRCNYLTLGWTPTEGELALRASQGETEEELRARAAEILPMGRMCEITDYIEALIYLFSDESRMMTGSTLRITAGEYI